MARLVVFGTLLLALVAVVLWRITSGPTIDEELTESWVIEYHGAMNPDARASRYLSRRTASGLRRVSNKLYDAVSIGDDCVLYIDGGNDLSAVCGERHPVYIALLGGDYKPALNVPAIRIDEREYVVADIKRAAREIDIERIADAWLVQRRAFPEGDGSSTEYMRYREDGYGGTYATGSSVLAYRSLGDDCLMWVTPGRPGRYGVFAVCGPRYDVLIGTVEAPSDIERGDAIRINGALVPVSDIKQRALAERG